MATEARNSTRRSARPRAAVPIQIDVPGLEIRPGDTVVDVGCWDGTVCAYAGKCRSTVVGIDIRPEAIRRTEEAMRDVPARGRSGGW